MVNWGPYVSAAAEGTTDILSFSHRQHRATTARLSFVLLILLTRLASMNAEPKTQKRTTARRKGQFPRPYPGTRARADAPRSRMRANER